MPMPIATDPRTAPSHAMLHTTVHANVKAYGAVGDGATDDRLSIQLAINSGAGIVYFPAGTYHIGSGTNLTPHDNQLWLGAGANKTILKSKNAYVVSSTSLTTSFGIRDMSLFQQDNSSSGGAISLSGGNAGLLLDNIVTGGGPGSTVTGDFVYLGGMIGGRVDRCTFTSGVGHAFNLTALDTGNKAANAGVITRSKFGPTTYNASGGAGLYLNGASGITVASNIFEDCAIGISMTGCNWITIEANWFEADKDDHIYSYDSAAQIAYNKFHYQSTGNASAQHINLQTSLAAPSSVGGNTTVLGNIFQDAPNNATYYMTIDQYLNGVMVLYNYKLRRSVLHDQGDNTIYVGQFDAAVPESAGYWRVKTPRTAAALGGDPSSAECVFLVDAASNGNRFMIGSRGVPIFVTGDTSAITGSDELGIGSFAFYWDNAAGQIKARVRKNDGSYTTLVVA